MNATTTYIYIVHSDINENNIYAEFADEQAAIEYARKNAAELTYVDKVEVLLDDDGDVEEELGSETIWVYSDEAVATETEDDYWDDLAAMYAEEETNKHDLGDTTWFESMDNLVETLEENEDEVECKECFDLFPKADCIKVDFGYICPTCAEGGTVSEDEIFKIDFPEYEKFSDGNAMVPEEPTIPVESSEEIPQEDPENEIIPISTPEEAVPFLVSDEEEAIAGYEKAAEIVAESDLENKEEILDTIEHIKEEEEEHIEELIELVDSEEEKVPEDPEDEDVKEETPEEEVEEIEDPEAEPVEEAMSDFQRKLIDKLPSVTKDEFQKKLESGESEIIFTGDPRETGIRGRTYEVSYEDGKYTVAFWDETYNDDFTDSEVAEEFDNIDDLWTYMVNFMEDDDFSPEYNYVTEALTEHVNEEHPAIESDQELEGTDNAVVDCKVADVVTHSEDEKPVDCEGKKEPLNKALTEAFTHDELSEIFKLCKEIGIVNGGDLKRFIQEVPEGENLLDKLRVYRAELGDDFKIEEKLTEAKRDPFHEAIFEAIDYLTEFSDIFPVPENIGATNWEELKDDINYGLSSDFEIAEIIMEYFQKDLAIGEKHPEIFEDDPQSELTLETYNRLKRAYDKAVADYEAMYPEDFEEQLDLTHGYDHIKSVATLVHKAVDNYTKENRVGTRPSGTAIYVIGAKSSSDPEKMKKIILDTLSENGYEPDVVDYIEGGDAYGYSIDKIKATARMTMSYQKRENLIEEVEDDVLATNSRGDYLVKNSSGRGYSVFSTHNVWQGGFECDDDEKAVSRFNRGDINESAILAAAASGIIVDVVKRIFDKFGDGKKKSKWIDFRKYIIEKTPEGQINIWNLDGEQVESDLKTIKAAKEKIKLLPKPKKIKTDTKKDTDDKDAEPVTESVKTNGAHEDIVFFANEIDAHFNKKYEIEILDGYKIHLAGETTDMTSEINSVKNIAANNLEADTEKLSDGTYVYMLKKKATATAESLTEDADEDEIEPISVDPEEKPSKNVKMANTAGTAGMDFEAACQKFGIELNN